MSRRLASLVMAALVAGALASLAWAQPGASSPAAAMAPVGAQHAQTISSLSPYWHAKVQRWASLIVAEATQRNLDPDLLASLVWIESRGAPEAIGPAGATGLMQIMPKEAGFSWRPTREQLLDPEVNLHWGTGTLATVIRQGDGDVFRALAAYNGGWDKADNHRPQLFATTILRDYAAAIAREHQLEGAWTAVFAVGDEGLHGPIWIAESERNDVYFFGDANLTPEGGPLIPAVAPTSVVARCQAPEGGAPFYVGLWVFDQAQGQWVTGDPVAPSPTPAPAVVVAAEVSPASPSASDAGAAQRCGAPPSLTLSSAASIAQPAAAPAADQSPEPAMEAAAAPASTPVAVPAFACSGGPLVLDAYPLERVTTIEGWKIRIYASGHGGDCTYTYAWNDESDVRAANVRGPITFEVGSTRRGAAIVGTVVLKSAGETVRVGIYVDPSAP